MSDAWDLWMNPPLVLGRPLSSNHFNKKDNMSYLRASDLKVGDKIRLKPGVTARSNAILLKPGEEYQIISKSASGSSVNVDIGKPYPLNLDTSYSLRYVERVPVVEYRWLTEDTDMLSIFDADHRRVKERGKKGDRVVYSHKTYDNNGTAYVSAPGAERYKGGDDARIVPERVLSKYRVLPEPAKYEVTKKVMTEITIPCASGDGDKLVVDYDPKGALDGGPCLSLEVVKNGGDRTQRFNGIDIEDAETLAALSNFIDQRRDDFRRDAK